MTTSVPRKREPEAGSVSPEAWISQEAALQVLREVVARCDRAGIPVLPVKGVVTSRMLYDDPAQRLVSDVDVRILPRDYWRWSEMARAAGWRCWSVNWTYRNRAYDFGSVALDVAADVGPRGFCGLTVETMLSRATLCVLAPGLRILVPEIHDHAVALTVNAFKKRLVTGNPCKILDLERIVRHEDFVPDVFVNRVAEAGISALTWIVASWMEAMRGSVPWGAIRASIEEAHAQANPLYARAYRWVATPERGTAFATYFVAMAGADGLLRACKSEALALAWAAEMWSRARLHAGPWG